MMPPRVTRRIRGRESIPGGRRGSSGPLALALLDARVRRRRPSGRWNIRVAPSRYRRPHARWPRSFLSARGRDRLPSRPARTWRATLASCRLLPTPYPRSVAPAGRLAMRSGSSVIQRRASRSPSLKKPSQARQRAEPWPACSPTSQKGQWGSESWRLSGRAFSSSFPGLLLAESMRVDESERMSQVVIISYATRPFSGEGMRLF